VHREEILAGGGPDIGFAGKLDAQYQAIYDSYKRGDISATEAAHRMGQVMANEGLSGTNGTTYRDDIQRRAEEDWARQQAKMGKK
jgi:sugar phosphate isomerase/epimerase